MTAPRPMVKLLVSLSIFIPILTEKTNQDANEGVPNHLDCTTLVSHNSAAISVCGGVDDDTSVTSCSDIAAFANQIQQTCNSGNPVRAGGMFTISASKRVEVIHS